MPARRLIAILAVCALPLAGCGGSSGQNANTAATIGSTQAIRGSWTGTLTQAGRPPFRVATVIDANGGAAVAYTGIDCGGVWALTSGPGSSRTYVFKETIVGAQPGSCKSSGTVTLTPASGGRLGYHFTGGGVQSTGTLAPASIQAVQTIFREAGTSTLR